MTESEKKEFARIAFEEWSSSGRRVDPSFGYKQTYVEAMKNYWPSGEDKPKEWNE